MTSLMQDADDGHMATIYAMRMTSTQKILEHNQRLYAALKLIRDVALENMKTDKCAKFIAQSVDDVLRENG